MAEPSYVNAVRTTCQNVQSLPDLPAVADLTEAAAFGDRLDIEAVQRLGASLAQDTNFTCFNATFKSVEQEAGCILVAHALDFGGGWRRELHAHHGKGAWITVKAGIEAMVREQPDLPAEWLAEVGEEEVGRLYGLGGSDSVSGLVRHLTCVTNELGTQIKAKGLHNPADFLVSFLQTSTSAHGLVQHLVESFPLTFNDEHTLDGRPVKLYKKAQLVVGELFHRFRKEDPRFAFPDGATLTAFIDNVICAVLRKEGVVVVTSALSEAIESFQPLPSGSREEVSLRAAAMVGVEAVTNHCRAKGATVVPMEIGNYLWGYLGKVPEYRKYTRHITKDTVFY